MRPRGDDQYFDQARSEVPLELDLAALIDRLPRGTELLVRTHNMMTGRVTVPTMDEVHDVSYHPDIRDLYLAADVLVTDYSSVMFDVAITGKPMVFYTYDLDRFRGSIRGFYFDLEPLAPGPIVDTLAGLTEALQDPGAMRDAFRDCYAAFRRNFAHLEDGAATTRVLHRLGLGSDSPVSRDQHEHFAQMLPG